MVDKNVVELAALLNGREYGSEMTKDQEKLAKEYGLVVVHGYSDDNIEFRGAISDEVGSYNGATVLVDSKGLLPSRDSIEDDEDLEDFFNRRKSAKKIIANWSQDGYSWTYSTEIPHVTFEIMEDGEKYCRGIVFALADVNGETQVGE